MKKIILLIFITYTYNSVNATYVGGCFPRNDIESEIKLKPNNPCIDTNLIKTCINSINLSIGIKCNQDYDIFNQDGEKINLHAKTNVTGYIKTYNDYTIPQDFSKWERKLINKNNPEDIIYIKGNNYSKYYELDNGLGIRKELFYIIFLGIIFGLLYKKGVIKNLISKIKTLKK